MRTFPVAAVAVASLALTGANRPVRPESRSAASVIALDTAWGAAERNRNAKFVSDLLQDGYVSVGSDGRITTKAQIVARASLPSNPARLEKVRAWKQAHPTEPHVRLTGNMAVLTWVSVRPDDKGAIVSCDIFSWAGRWQAVYSQHTSAGS